MSEAGKEYGEAISEYRRVKNIERTDKLKKFAERFGIKITEFAPNSWRLEKEGKPTIDYYPPSGKAYSHRAKVWFQIKHLFPYLQKVYE